MWLCSTRGGEKKNNQKPRTYTGSALKKAPTTHLFLFRSLPLGLAGQRAPLSAPRCLPASPDAAPHRAEAQWVRCSTLPHGSRAGFAACALAQWPLPRPPSVWYSAHLFSPFKGASRSSTSSQLCGCDFHLPLQTSGRELSYLRSVRASKDIHRGIDSAIHLGLAKLTCPIV